MKPYLFIAEVRYNFDKWGNSYFYMKIVRVSTGKVINIVDVCHFGYGNIRQRILELTKDLSRVYIVLTEMPSLKKCKFN